MVLLSLAYISVVYVVYLFGPLTDLDIEKANLSTSLIDLPGQSLALMKVRTLQGREVNDRNAVKISLLQLHVEDVVGCKRRR